MLAHVAHRPPRRDRRAPPSPLPAASINKQQTTSTHRRPNKPASRCVRTLPHPRSPVKPTGQRPLPPPTRPFTGRGRLLRVPPSLGSRRRRSSVPAARWRCDRCSAPAGRLGRIAGPSFVPQPPRGRSAARSRSEPGPRPASVGSGRNDSHVRRPPDPRLSRHRAPSRSLPPDRPARWNPSPSDPARPVGQGRTLQSRRLPPDLVGRDAPVPTYPVGADHRRWRPMVGCRQPIDRLGRRVSGPPAAGPTGGRARTPEDRA